MRARSVRRVSEGGTLWKSVIKRLEIFRDQGGTVVPAGTSKLESKLLGTTAVLP